MKLSDMKRELKKACEQMEEFRDLCERIHRQYGALDLPSVRPKRARKGREAS